MLCGSVLVYVQLRMHVCRVCVCLCVSLCVVRAVYLSVCVMCVVCVFLYVVCVELYVWYVCTGMRLPNY